jgi:2,4-dienoyl-CoA reductase-like NADH-dependent reductase (Old Yellow Enzyme family)
MDIHMETNQLTLRDRFAMAALTGMLAGDPNYPTTWEDAADAAYLAADAMLAARRCPYTPCGEDES